MVGDRFNFSNSVGIKRRLSLNCGDIFFGNLTQFGPGFIHGNFNF